LRCLLALIVIATGWSTDWSAQPDKSVAREAVVMAGEPKEVPGVPAFRAGVTVSREAVMAGLIDDAAQRMNEILARSIERLAAEPGLRAAQFSGARQIALLRELEAIRLRTVGQARGLVTGAVSESVLAGIRKAERELRALGISTSPDRPGAGVEFNVVNQRAIETVTADTLTRLDGAIANHERRATALFRSLSATQITATDGEAAVNRAIARGIITGDRREAEKAMRNLFRDPSAPELESYRKLGNKQIEVGGWTGTVRAYTSTVVRTRTREATVLAAIDRQTEAGYDLAQVVGKVSANFCTDYLGLVVVVNGPGRDGYPGINEIPEGPPPFHPNCSKSLAVYIPELVSAGRTTAHQTALQRFNAAA